MNSIHCEGDFRRAELRIVELEKQNEDLRYHIDYWKREACQLADSDCAAALQHLFDLTESESAICSVLYQRRGKNLPLLSLEGLLDEERGHSVESNVVCVMISHIREKLGHRAIETSRGRGYRLSADTIARFDTALKSKR